MTVSGTVVSLAPGGSDVVVGGSTEALAPYITAGFGGGPNGTGGVKAFEGVAEGRVRWGPVGLVWMLGVGVWVGLG